MFLQARTCEKVRAGDESVSQSVSRSSRVVDGMTQLSYLHPRRIGTSIFPPCLCFFPPSASSHPLRTVLYMFVQVLYK